MKHGTFGISFQEYILKNKSEQDRIKLNYYERNKEYAENKLDELKADWILILGTSGRIHNYGICDNFPETEELENIGNETGEFPSLFHRQPIIEEESIA